MNELAQNITAKYSLVEVVQSSGVNLMREGAVWVGDCPFHDDHNAALLVEPTTQHWQCDGACQTGGTLIEWIMKAHAISREEAIDWIQSGKDINCMPLADHQPSTVLSSTQEDKDLNQSLIDYYHKTLKGHPQALAYLKQRKIDHPEVLEHFKLGFSDRSLGHHLPLKNRKEGAAIRGRLQRMGWLKPSGHELMRGSLVIPVINDGQLRQAYGRKITLNLRSGTPDHVYLQTEHHGVFNLEALKASEEWIVCQSLIDALTFWSAGFRNVTTHYHLGALHQDLLHAIQLYCPKRLLIAFEATANGEQVAEKTAAQLNDVNTDNYRIELPKGMDVNDVAVKHANHQQVLGEVIRKAVWLGKGRQPDTACVTDEAGSEQTAVEVIVSTGLPDPQQADDIEIDEYNNNSTEYEAPLPATVSPAPPIIVDKASNDIELIFNFENRKYRVRGLENNKSFDQLRINVLVNLNGAIHVDSFDLYSTKHRQAFIKLAAIEVGIDENVIKKDLSQLLLQLEIEQQNLIKSGQRTHPTQKELTNQEHKQAMVLLQSPNLIGHIVEDLTQCGLVGEDNNKLLAYLVSLSRKLEKPLAVIVQSTSAAGKSALMNHVLSFVPEEERIQYSALTGQSLFYMSDLNLKHKILAISENEGVSQAAYALRVLQSEGALSIATTGKDPLTGKHTTHEYKVEGPVTIFSTTTAVDIDEELLNRCLVIQVDEDAEQTKVIHQRQRLEETLQGMQFASQKQAIIQQHQNAQRLLKPLIVVNPYAEHLTFTSSQTRTRRDHPKYLTLIRTIALLHQHQREIKTTYLGDKQVAYIEVTIGDIEIANQLLDNMLGHSLIDLPPQTRKLLTLVNEMVTERCKSKSLKRQKVRFTRRDVQEYTGWGMTQIAVHLRRLETMEYVLRHRGKQGQLMVYELLYQTPSSTGTHAGLVDAEQLKNIITQQAGDVSNQLPATSRGSDYPLNQTIARGHGSLHGFTGFSGKHAGVITPQHRHKM